MKPWVLVDLSYLCHRALHSVGGLSHGDVGSTGVLFGFFSQLLTLCRDPRVDSNKVVIFADSRTSYRRDSFEGYKAKRRERPKTTLEVEALRGLWTQQTLLRREILPALGVRVVSQRGLESDDLLASAAAALRYQAARNSDETRQAVIITGDGDLWQCVSRAVHWYDHGRRVYYDPKGFKAAKGVWPRRWGEVKALAGCKSDNVPGVPGVGEGTAVKYLLGTLPLSYKVHGKIESASGRAVVERNRELVVLPHSKTGPVKLRAPRWDLKAFLQVCERYGLRTFQTKSHQWEALFNGVSEHRGFKLRRKGETYDD